MARYRRVYSKIWDDDRFRALSERAKLVWLYLLTGPETTSLPGVIRTGRSQLCEAMADATSGTVPDLVSWAEPCDEVFDTGMARADWPRRVVWVPNALRYNPPHNPNVVRGWATAWCEIPECDLKNEAHAAFSAFLESFPESYLRSWTESFPEPSPKPAPNHSPNHSRVVLAQDQDSGARIQEQERGTGGEPFDAARQEPDPEPIPKRARTARARPASQLDAGFGLTEARIETARRIGVPTALISAEFDAFRDFHQSRASLFADWEAAWRTWARNSLKFGARNGPMAPQADFPSPHKPFSPPEPPKDLVGRAEAVKMLARIGAQVARRVGSGPEQPKAAPDDDDLI